MSLRTLPKLPRISGDVTERDKHVKDVEDPEEDQDAATMAWVTDNF